MKKILVLALGLFLLSLAHSRAWAVNATLSWHPTTKNANGAPLTNLSGYKVYYGTIGSTYSQVVNVGLTAAPAAPAYTITNLAAGRTYYFAVTAYDFSGNESKFSNEVSKTFASSVTTTTTRIKTTTTVRSATSTTTRATTTTTVLGGSGFPKADALTYNATTKMGTTQSFTATYSDPDGWRNLADATFYIAGAGRDQWLHYNPVTNSFSMDGAIGSCKPGQSATLSSLYLFLICGNSRYSVSGKTLTVTFSVAPKGIFAGTQYRLVIVAYDKTGKSSGKLIGYWTVNQSQSPG